MTLIIHLDRHALSRLLEQGAALKNAAKSLKNRGGPETCEGPVRYDHARSHARIFSYKKGLTMRRPRSNSPRKPLPKLSEAVATKARRTGELSPLDYMLSVINDAKADPARRDRMAICAAQSRKSGRLSQEGRRGEAAEKAGGGEWGEDLASDRPQ